MMQQYAVDKAGNVWDNSDPANPKFVSGAQSAPAKAGGIFTLPQTAEELRDEQRKDASEARSERTATRSDATAARGVVAQERQAEVAEAGLSKQAYDSMMKLRSDYDAMPAVKEYRVAIAQMAQALETADDATGDNALTYAYAKAMDPGSVVRESEMTMAGSGDSVFDAKAAAVRKQFGMDGGGQFSPQIRDRMRREILNKVTKGRMVYDVQRKRYENDSKRYGIDPESVIGAHDGEPFRPILKEYNERKGSAQGEGSADTPKASIGATPTISLGGPSQAVATGETRNQYDPNASKALDRLIRKQTSFDEVKDWAQRNGHTIPDEGSYRQAVDFARSNPGHTKLLGEVTRQMPNSALNRAMASPLATIGTQAVNAATGGFLDEIGGGINSLVTGAPLGESIAAADRAKQAQAQLNPKSALLGNVIGGVGAVVGGSALLNGALRSGVQGGLGRNALAWAARNPVKTNLLTDGAYGATYGAGEFNDNRLTGAAIGTLGGVGGGMAGAGIAKGVGRAIAPTGGGMAPLYEQGVYPTLGQRLAEKGPLGRFVNTTEQALQSIPLLGGVVSRARQIPRDAYEKGGFNQALGEIGDALPKGMDLGTEPHAYMQGAFDKAYDTARGGMRFAPDQPYKQELGAFVKDLDNGVLSGDQAKRVGSILRDAVESRMTNGALEGDAFKAASSAVSSAAKQLDRTEPGMSQALNRYGTLLDNAARRQSDPAASQLLDNADAGYAKAVRIEDAAAARGGDTGRYSPTQFDKAVQKGAGGVRSRSYLRGDALMSDYASAGKGLADTLPNSGSADRVMMGQLIGGGALSGLGAVASPFTAAKVGLATLPYLPGVNHLMTRAMAPRQSAGVNAFGQGLADQAVKAGTLTGGLSIPLLLQYLNGQ